MNILHIENPEITVPILLEDFKKMPAKEFGRYLRDTLKRGEEFLKSNDNEFSASLDQADATMYACYVRTFLDSFKELKKSEFRSLQAPLLAKTISWWRVISVFKTMHEKTPAIG